MKKSTKRKIWKILKKETREFSIAVSACAITILFLIVSLMLIFPHFVDGDMAFTLMTKNYNLQDSITNITMMKCSHLKGDMEKIYCVHNIFISLYDYTEHNDSLIRTPEKTLLEGGVCRDAAVFF